MISQFRTGENMVQLTEHFTDQELHVDGADPRIVGNAKFLCIQILEPLREKFGALLIHSGYRDPAHNEQVGGVHGSFHLYAGEECAADFAPIPSASASLELIFDWMRLESKLPFDHIILEHDQGGHPACIHVQAHVDFAQRRARGAYLRSTGKANDTVECDCEPA
jgi:zinc D-Ala-D-Ala carboxypeptidase